MNNEWKYKVWINDTALSYLNGFPNSDIWSLPLEEWIYHSLAECSLLFAAISNSVPEICTPLLQSKETEDLYLTAISSIKEQYVNRFPEFAKFRLASKINDLLLLKDRIEEIIQNDADIYKEAIEELAEEICDCKILPRESLAFNKAGSLPS